MADAPRTRPPGRAGSPPAVEDEASVVSVRYSSLSDQELADPTPDVHALFVHFNGAYFDGRLTVVTVSWSPRMTLCAGLCVFNGRECAIRLSEPLLRYRPRSDLINTLLHEMIHAFLFLTAHSRDRSSHGPEFQRHMSRINSKAGTTITIYHSFHDEVNYYHQHVWRCQGPCRERGPFFGFVRRAMNRAPQKADWWWAEHQRTCGGQYVKISEPTPSPSVGSSGSRKRRRPASRAIDQFLTPRSSSPSSSTSTPRVPPSPPRASPLTPPSHASPPRPPPSAPSLPLEGMRDPYGLLAARQRRLLPPQVDLLLIDLTLDDD